MPQNPIWAFLFGKKAKATPKPVEEKLSPSEYDWTERLMDRVDELENDAAGKEARIARLETDLQRLREQAGFA
jgi:hypothetical protein